MLLDESVLLQSCGDDEDFARELFAEYQKRVLQLLSHMRSACNDHNIEEIRKAAHELKGSSLTLGATQLAHLSRNIEDGCKSGQTQLLSDWLQDLKEQAHLLFEYLKKKGYL